MSRIKWILSSTRRRISTLGTVAVALAIIVTGASTPGATARALEGPRPTTPTASETSTPHDGRYGTARHFHVRDGVIHADDRPIVLFGLNWAGLETRDRAPHGLWTGRSLEDYLTQIRELGFTAVRFPLTPDVLRPGLPVAEWAEDAGYGPTGERMLIQTLVATWRAGLWVVLGFNSYDSTISGGDTPAPVAIDGSYTEGDWIADLRALTRLTFTFPNIVGIDLFNEPYGLSWEDWREMAGRGGAAVLDVNPRVVVFVQGVGERGTSTGGFGAFWGGNLTEAADAPIDPDLIPREKLVFSPHVYGPDVYDMPYFRAEDYPRNLPAIWDTHFGHLAGNHAVCPGEFGGTYAPGSRDRIWQDTFVAYMKSRRGMANCWFYWQFAPTSRDTGGLLGNDWATTDSRKLMLLRRLKHAGTR